MLYKWKQIQSLKENKNIQQIHKIKSTAAPWARTGWRLWR